MMTLFSGLPTVPPIDTSISTGLTWLIDLIGNVCDVLRMIYGQTLFLAIVAAMIVILNFEWVYHSVMWIIHKIPAANIS